MLHGPLRRHARAAGALLAAGLAATALAGCSGSAAAAGGCVGRGDASDAVEASGEFATAPTVTFPAPLYAEQTQATTLIEGRGAEIRPDQNVIAEISILNASTGEAVTQTGYTTAAEAPLFTVSGVPIPGLQQAIVCARPGERLAVAIPPEDGYPADLRPTALGATDAMVAVVDVRAAYLAKADGRSEVMAGDLPSVVLAPNGQPGVTVPDSPPPARLRVANLKTGSGAVIGEGDTAIAHFTGVLWDDERVFDSSWTNGNPVRLTVQGGTGGIIPGLATALKGQRVGSQVLAVLPPDQAYGAEGSGAVPADATLVFVVDLLGKA